MLKNYLRACYSIIIVLCCSCAYGSILTFDDVPSGTELGAIYNDSYRVWFSFFEAVDHTESTWGSPHSVTNVMAWSSGEDLSLGGLIQFGYFTPSEAEPDNVKSVDAFFSTKLDSAVKITAYKWIAPDNLITVASTVIGAIGQSWDNRHVQISSSNETFNMLKFEGLNTPDDLLGFCADDMTIELVPEPSSLLALLGGLTGIGGIALRKRRM